MDDARSMRAVKGSLGHSPRERYSELEKSIVGRAQRRRSISPHS